MCFFIITAKDISVYQSKGKNTEVKNKLISLIVVSVLLFTTLIQASASNTASCWYIKRNGKSTPTFSKDATTVDKYNGYYVDKKAAECGKKILYLTFDAGYENGNISDILDTLKSENVPAAFFILDNLILKNTDLVKRMAEEGHTVCNHTKNHRDLTRCSKEQIAKDLSDLEKLYEEKTGYTMSKYFRFPEGKYNKETLDIVSSLGYTTVFWSFAYDDWDNNRQPSAEKAMNKILSNTHDGAVILLHPTSSTNAEILPRLIKEWKSMGYSFGTLDELTK